jgi:ABC-2 type transport system ATP-binding protein
VQSTEALHTTALHFDNVTKRFGETVAVDSLTLSVEPGAFVGLLGRNGAGKSTSIKMATGLMQPTSGRVIVFGQALHADAIEVRKRIGVMPEDMALLDLLSGEQYLRFVGRMYGLEDAGIDQRTAELFDTLDLRPGPGTVVGDYSFGMKKKLSLCAALIHSPKLVFLDEPFEGIDALTNRTIKDILSMLQKRGVTLVLTTHILEVVEKICPTIAIIDNGKLQGFGTLESLRQGHGSLEEYFVSLVGAGEKKVDLSWL